MGVSCPPLQLSLQNARVLVNDEGTRSFAALAVQPLCDSVNHMTRLLKHVNQAVTSFGGQAFYEAIDFLFLVVVVVSVQPSITVAEAPIIGTCTVVKSPVTSVFGA